MTEYKVKIYCKYWDLHLSGEFNGETQQDAEETAIQYCVDMTGLSRDVFVVAEIKFANPPRMRYDWSW